MSETDILEKQKAILAKLFSLPNKLQAVGEQRFAGEMTLRQWLLTVAVAQCGDSSLTLGKLADLMGSSHQNVKQLALKLQKGGFLSMKKNKTDLRVIHLSLTDKSREFWKRRQEEIRQYFAGLFMDFDDDEIDYLYDCIDRLYDNILKMEKELLNDGGVYNG